MRCARSRQQRVGDVAAVELADRHQVERGHEQAEPGGEAERPDDAGSGSSGSGPCTRRVDPLEQQRLAEEDRRRPSVGAAATVASRTPSQSTGRQTRNPASGPGDADVEEGAAVGDRAADADEGAERADEAEAGQRETE